MGESLGTVVLDATVLSNFAHTDTIDLLIDDTGVEAATVPTVLNEICDGIDAGYEFLESIAEHAPIRTKEPIATPRTSSAIHVLSAPVHDEQDRRIVRELDPGEARCLLGARESGGVLATDDMDARETARRCDVSLTGSIGLLARAVEQERIGVETADEHLGCWIETNDYRSPVASIADALSDE